MKNLLQKAFNIYIISIMIIIFATLSCAKKPDNPLIIPPNFAKMPNLDEEEVLDEKQRQGQNLQGSLEDILLPI